MQEALGLPTNNRFARRGDFVHTGFTISGSVSISFEMAMSDSQKASSSCFDSVSVGSIMSAPCTIMGKLTV